MDALDFFLVRYDQIHRVLSDPAIKQLSEAQLRGRPHPRVNTIAWLLWHMARVEDVGVNRFVADRPQVLEDGWLTKLGVDRRDVGTGMSDAEVDEFSRPRRPRRASWLLGRGHATHARGRGEPARKRSRRRRVQGARRARRIG